MTLLTLLSAQAAPPPPQEAFATGGFLPNDRRERDRRNRALRATMERVVAPPVVVERVAEEIREAVAPQPAAEVVQDARFAVTLGQVDGLRAMLDAVRGRMDANAAAQAAAIAAAEEDEEDVLMLLGAL